MIRLFYVTATVFTLLLFWQHTFSFNVGVARFLIHPSIFILKIYLLPLVIGHNLPNSISQVFLSPDRCWSNVSLIMLHCRNRYLSISWSFSQSTKIREPSWTILPDNKMLNYLFTSIHCSMENWRCNNFFFQIIFGFWKS